MGRDKKSMMYRHCVNNNHKHIFEDNFEVIGVTTLGIKRKIAEALLIKERSPNHNE